MQERTRTLTIIMTLTALFVLAQILFVVMHFAVDIDGIVFTAIKNTLHLSIRESTAILQFIFTQCLLYALYIYSIWYTVITISKTLSLTPNQNHFLTYILCFASYTAIITANAYYAPHSFFATLLNHDLLHDAQNTSQLYAILVCASAICFIAIGFATTVLFTNLCQRQLALRDSITTGLIVFFVVATNIARLPNSHFASAATMDKPNIFVIGFDAVRPDFLTFFDQNRQPTPHFDRFLQAATVFSNAYTPLARTFPAWLSMLTGIHPVHNHAREDMINIHSVNATETLPKILQQAGYTTIYASDDNRFSNVNNALFGFDQLIGPPGNATDFILSAINDFPLSNLMIPTYLGKWLFPYNHANHASAATYDPDNFLALITKTLQQNTQKPIFLAAHFNITAWPFYWFNDHQPSSISGIAAYKQTVIRGDQLLNDFMAILDQQGLLQHAIFVLVSDHGIALQIPGDRIVAEKFYQGDKTNIPLKRSRYNINLVFDKQKSSSDTNEAKTIFLDTLSNNNTDTAYSTILTATSAQNPDLYGIDTSYGYGNDVLSLKQYHSLLAFKLYGLREKNIPHLVADRNSMLDITPTILDLLHLPSLANSEGSSLKPYLLNPSLQVINTHPIFLESNYSTDEIEKNEFNANKVALTNLSLFEVDPTDDLVHFAPLAEKAIIANKQRAILFGDWLLAYYPTTDRYKAIQLPNHQIRFERYTAPPYAVLVNIKTKKWTTDLQSTFAQNSPVKNLNQQLWQFYGNEMKNYGNVAAIP